MAYSSTGFAGDENDGLSQCRAISYIRSDKVNKKGDGGRPKGIGHLASATCRDRQTRFAARNHKVVIDFYIPAVYRCG
jgi:hypothetical protein